MIREIDKDSINYSFKRLINFIAVNNKRDVPEQIDGLRAYGESVGMDEDLQDYLFEECENVFHDPGSIFVGILLGLAVVEHLEDR